MKPRALALPSWVEDERSLLRYLMSPHDGHAYGEELLEAVSLVTSWVLVAISVLAVVGVLSDAILR